MSAMQNPFEGTLAGLDALDAEGTFRVLSAFCDSIRSQTDNVVECWAAPGYLTDLGQEYRIMLKAGEADHLLLRAHVPAAGFPVKLDLYDEDLTECRTESELRQQLGLFLQKDAIRNVIAALRQAGLHSPRRMESGLVPVSREGGELTRPATTTAPRPAIVSSVCFGTAAVAGCAIAVYQTNSAAPLLWAMACLTSGAVVGFLFAIPRTQHELASAKQPLEARPSREPTASNTLTNLDLVSDWLTKILIGLGLVHLRDLPGYIETLAAVLVEGVGPDRMSQSIAAAQIVYFAALGFLGGYVVTRVLLAELFRRAGKS